MRGWAVILAALSLSACMEGAVEAALDEAPLGSASATKLAGIAALDLDARAALVEAAWVAEGCVARDDDLARFNAAVFVRLDDALGLSAVERQHSDFIAEMNGVFGDGADALEEAGRLVYDDGKGRIIAPGCPSV